MKGGSKLDFFNSTGEGLAGFLTATATRAWTGVMIIMGKSETLILQTGRVVIRVRRLLYRFAQQRRLLQEAPK